MSVRGQKRRFRRAHATSDRLSTTDISVAAGLPPVQTREGAQTIVNRALLGFCEVHREATLSFEVKAPTERSNATCLLGLMCATVVKSGTDLGPQS
jgi:hypothetical protein